MESLQKNEVIYSIKCSKKPSSVSIHLFTFTTYIRKKQIVLNQFLIFECQTLLYKRGEVGFKENAVQMVGAAK